MQSEKVLKICNRIIEYFFYALFFLVPLVFTGDTSELFEFNKMWLTFIITIIITAAWLIKMIVQKEIFVQKTPLDIPIGLFLISLVISSVFSLDSHVSLWGYYSRFNGGLLSMVSYVLLYYAFVSNFSLARGGNPLASELKADSGFMSVLKSKLGDRLSLSEDGEASGNKTNYAERHLATRVDAISAITMVKRILMISLAAGAVVALWGLPSHFGYDPTCFIFRGTFDVSCWTSDFQPKVRIFSTLGQPAWLGAYLAVLIPIALQFQISNFKSQMSNKNVLFALGFLLLAALFYLDVLFTQSRAAFLAVWITVPLFTFFVLRSRISLRETGRLFKMLEGIIIVFLILTFMVGTPFAPLNKLTFESLKNSKPQTVSEGGLANPSGGGTDSGKIRLLVWQGAIDAWRANPIFGTGVETFAFAYYKYRPQAHNLTSEWNFLYNKAHNEYLNFLATTGLFGLGSYLLMIGVFFYKALGWAVGSESGSWGWLLRKRKESSPPSSHLNSPLTSQPHRFLIIALLSSYISILITNFFGFSVVITNVYLFLIPAFVFILMGHIRPISPIGQIRPIGKIQKLDIFVTVLAAFYLIFNLANFWLADKSYGLGENLSRAGEYRKAYLSLKDAVSRANFEPVFRDETAVNDAQLAVSLLSASETAALAQKLSKDAVLATAKITEQHPNNIVFWKSQVRIFYTLSQADPRYLPLALDSLKKAKELAPTDANISYNLGLLYGQSGDSKKAIETLENTIKLKSNYTNAYYALGLFYHQLGEEEKAIALMKYILEKLDPKNEQAKDALKTWTEAQ